jgi:hypothetical protein
MDALRKALRYTGLLPVAAAVATFAVIAFSPGCAPTSLQTYKVFDYSTIAKKTYKLYAYSFGMGDRLRVVLLVNPESGTEVLPYSEGIVTTTGTFEDAMAYMKRGVYSEIEVDSVAYKGRTIGYLLKYVERGVITDPVYLEPSLFERGGKIYFSVQEMIYYGGGDRLPRMHR